MYNVHVVSIYTLEICLRCACGATTRLSLPAFGWHRVHFGRADSASARFETWFQRCHSHKTIVLHAKTKRLSQSLKPFLSFKSWASSAVALRS